LISDILLISNRYFEIIKKQIFLKRLSKTSIILISFSFTFIIISPCYFTVYVFIDPTNGLFKSYFNEIGFSVYFNVYYFVLFLLEIVLPLFTYLYMSIVYTVKFKRVMARTSPATRSSPIKPRIASPEWSCFILSSLLWVTSSIWWHQHFIEHQLCRRARSIKQLSKF